MKPEPWVSVEEVAEHLGIKRETVYAWISKNGMPAHKVGSLWKLKLNEVDKWVRSGYAGVKPGGRRRC
jgi:excisionase family DNA binding protein